MCRILPSFVCPDIIVPSMSGANHVTCSDDTPKDNLPVTGEAVNLWFSPPAGNDVNVNWYGAVAMILLQSEFLSYQPDHANVKTFCVKDINRTLCWKYLIRGWSINVKLFDCNGQKITLPPDVEKCRALNTVGHVIASVASLLEGSQEEFYAYHDEYWTPQDMLVGYLVDLSGDVKLTIYKTQLSPEVRLQAARCTKMAAWYADALFFHLYTCM